MAARFSSPGNYAIQNGPPWLSLGSGGTDFERHFVQIREIDQPFRRSSQLTNVPSTQTPLVLWPANRHLFPNAPKTSGALRQSPMRTFSFQIPGWRAAAGAPYPVTSSKLEQPELNLDPPDFFARRAPSCCFSKGEALRFGNSRMARTACENVVKDVAPDSILLCWFFDPIPVSAHRGFSEIFALGSSGAIADSPSAGSGATLACGHGIGRPRFFRFRWMATSPRRARLSGRRRRRNAPWWDISPVPQRRHMWRPPEPFGGFVRPRVWICGGHRVRGRHVV